MKKKHGNLICIIAALFVFFSCNQQTVQHAGSCLTDTLLWADTANAGKTYRNITGRWQRSIDTFYSALATSLIRQNRYELLNEHLTYYKMGREQYPFVAALIARANGFAYNYEAKYDSARLRFEQAILLDKKLNNNRELAENYLGMATNEVIGGILKNHWLIIICHFIYMSSSTILQI